MWGGSFWSTSRSPIKRNSIFYVSVRCYPIPSSATFSVLACSVKRLSWHTSPTVISTRCYSIFKERKCISSKLWGQCSNCLSLFSWELFWNLLTAKDAVLQNVLIWMDYGSSIQFTALHFILSIGSRRKRVKPATKSKNILRSHLIGQKYANCIVSVKKFFSNR